MSKHGERDQVIDRLLREAGSPGAGSTGATPACVEPETLAAWVDGGLPAGAMAQVEEHLADCAHCQAVLATFAESEPAATAPVAVPSWSRWSLRWAAPLAAGIALVLTWSVLRLQAPDGAAEQTMARVEPATEPVPDGSLAQPLVVPPPPVTPADRGRSSERRADETRGQPRNAEAFAKAEAPVAAPTGTAETTRMMDQAAAPASASAPLARLALSSIVAEFGVGTAAGETRSARAEAPPPVAQGAERDRGPASGSAAAPAAPVRVIVRWRVTTAGLVERQYAGSSAWEPVAINPPAPVLNGAAPSASVCWLVGRNGLVLRTTNGTAFSRLPFPEAVDLTSVSAASAQSARVTTADGRTFTTTDGGETWR